MKLLLISLLLCVGQSTFAQTSHTYTITPTRRTLGNADLPEHIKDQLSRVYSSWLEPDEPPKLIPKKDALDFNLEFPKLSNNGQQIILLESIAPYAGATGNGENWFFLRSGDNVRLILHTSGFLFYPSYSYDVPHPVYRSGLRDIAIGWNVSSSEGGIQVFRFNGSHYVSDHCAEYTMDDNETFHFSPPKPCQTQTK